MSPLPWRILLHFWGCRVSSRSGLVPQPQEMKEGEGSTLSGDFLTDCAPSRAGTNWDPQLRLGSAPPADFVGQALLGFRGQELGVCHSWLSQVGVTAGCHKCHRYHRCHSWVVQVSQVSQVCVTVSQLAVTAVLSACGFCTAKVTEGCQTKESTCLCPQGLKAPGRGCSVFKEGGDTWECLWCCQHCRNPFPRAGRRDAGILLGGEEQNTTAKPENA